MEKEIIKDKIKNILKTEQFSNLENLIDNINDETSLINDIALDSIQILELIVAIEKEFCFSCKHEDLNLDMFDKFKYLVEYIGSNVSKQ